MAGGNERSFWAGATLLYFTVALLYFVLPLGGDFGKALLGTALFPHDSILNAGILEWGYRSIWSSQRHLFQWVAGFPVDNSLVVIDNLVGWQLFYSPLRAIGMSVPASYNIVLIVSFLISGLGTAALARQLGTEKWGALAAGLIFAFNPFHIGHAVHLQTMAVCWSPLALLFLDRYLSRGRLGDGLGLCLAVIMTVLSAKYFGVFLAIMMPGYVLFSFVSRRHSPQLRILAGLAVAALVSFLAVLPVLLPYLRFATAHGYVHSLERLDQFSVRPSAFFAVPAWLATWAWTGLIKPDPRPAFPGAIALLLGLLFLIRALKEPEVRPVGIMLGLLGALAALFSFGPYLKGIPLPGQIFQFIGVRWPMRILPFAFLAGAVLCALGLSGAMAKFRGRWHVLVGCFVITLLVLEYRPATWYASRSVRVPAPIELSDAYPFLAQEKDRGAVVELPPSNEDGYRTPALVRYVYGSAGHLRRIVAILSSVPLPPVQALMDAAEKLPDDNSRRFLFQQGVTRLVVHRTFLDDQKFAELLERLDIAGYPRLHTGAEGVVYALSFP